MNVIFQIQGTCILKAAQTLFFKTIIPNFNTIFGLPGSRLSKKDAIYMYFYLILCVVISKNMSGLSLKILLKKKKMYQCF